MEHLDDPLEDLYTDAMLNRVARRQKKPADPSVRESLDAASEKLKAIYTNPDNWKRTRGVALIDRDSRSLVGNFSEYKHRTVPNTRRLVRETAPISVSATEEVSGYLGEQLAFNLRGKTWEEQRCVRVDVTFPEMMLGAPKVNLRVKLYLGGVIRAELIEDTQFASPSGNMILNLPAETNVLQHMGHDCKTEMRKEMGL